MADFIGFLRVPKTKAVDDFHIVEGSHKDKDIITVMYCCDKRLYYTEKYKEKNRVVNTYNMILNGCIDRWIRAIGKTKGGKRCRDFSFLMKLNMDDIRTLEYNIKTEDCDKNAFATVLYRLEQFRKILQDSKYTIYVYSKYISIYSSFVLPNVGDMVTKITFEPGSINMEFSTPLLLQHINDNPHKLPKKLSKTKQSKMYMNYLLDYCCYDYDEVDIDMDSPNQMVCGGGYA